MLQRRITAFNTEQKPSLLYLFQNGPDKFPPDRVINYLETKNGIFVNCQAYVAAVERALGIIVPDWYRSSEREEDPEGVYEAVNYPEKQVKNADVLGFSKTRKQDIKEIHLGIARVDRIRGIEILHASKDAGKVIVSRLADMMQEEKYATLRFVKRAKIMNSAVYNPSALQKLGFFV